MMPSYGGGGNGDEPPKLEPRNLFQKRVQRDKSRLRAYNQLLGQIHNRIQSTAQLTGNAQYVIYTVPPFILGLPAIDLQDCVVYLVHMLRNEGFEVKFTYPNLLYISWKHYERQYVAEESPIIQAMKPPAAPKNTSKRGAGGKRGAGDGGLSVTFAGAGGTGSLTGAGAAPARSAAEYQPPDSFMATMARPPARDVGGKGAAAVLEELWKL